ncbi:MAG: NAD(P)-dependent oxidoreductase [Methylococcales bacterium]|jgi:nucleoside-diphosphate-sugar epimerase|nr:NAD(P)-dependent oxidoreductase [Methylococcales bacterium]
MKVLVTGATGMIGIAMVRRLITRGDDVLALSRYPNNFPSDWQKIVNCQVTDYTFKQLRNHLSGVHAVVHLAAMRPNVQADTQGLRAYYAANVQITENLMQAAGDAGVTTLCQTSSISVYSSHNAVPYRETDAPHPLNFYGASKLACEYLGELYGRMFPLRVVSLRLARILGDDDKSGVDFMLMRFIYQAREKIALQLYGQGRGARDTLYIKDAVGAIERALADDAPSGVFNIGADRAITHREIAETINSVFNNNGNLVFETSCKEDFSIYYMDCGRAQSELGWCRYWSLRAGLEDMRSTYITLNDG